MNFESMSLDALSLSIQDLDHASLMLHTQKLVEKERELTAKSLVLFREIEKRMVHLEMGFSSLFDLLVQHFGFSEGCASRRVASVRLMSQIPHVEQQIKNGKLSLSNVAAAQRFFNAEAKNNNSLGLEEKKEILQNLVGKTTREAEKVLIQKSSLPISLQIPDQIKQKGDAHVEIRFLAPEALVELLEEAKGLLAHRLPKGASMADVIQALAEIGIERIKAERFGVGRKPKASPNTAQTDICAEENLKSEPQMPDTQKVKSRYIPVAVKRAVYLRADGRCEYIDKVTGRRCNSTQFPELDHSVTPFAKGGEHTVETLILACKNHNRMRAVSDFGAEWMGQFYCDTQ